MRSLHEVWVNFELREITVREIFKLVSRSEDFLYFLKIVYFIDFYRVLKIMNSISEECTDLKKNYDACFNSWYTEKFLRGETKSEPCKELFESYRACVLVRDNNTTILKGNRIKT